MVSAYGAPKLAERFAIGTPWYSPRMRGSMPPATISGEGRSAMRMATLPSRSRCSCGSSASAASAADSNSSTVSSGSERAAAASRRSTASHSAPVASWSPLAP